VEDAGIGADRVVDAEWVVDVGSEATWVEATGLEATGLEAEGAGASRRNGNIKRNLSTTLSVIAERSSRIL